MVDAYLTIGDALAHDQVDGLDELGSTLTKAAQTKRGEPGVDAIVQGASHLGGQDLAATRAAFEEVSTGMIEYLHAHPEQQQGRTIVHCPMAFGGKGGVWVQPAGKVINPYEGSRMLHCGDKLGWDAELPAT